jgi:hypothetical protein
MNKEVKDIGRVLVFPGSRLKTNLPGMGEILLALLDHVEGVQAEALVFFKGEQVGKFLFHKDVEGAKIFLPSKTLNAIPEGKDEERPWWVMLPDTAKIAFAVKHGVVDTELDIFDVSAGPALVILPYDDLDSFFP